MKIIEIASFATSANKKSIKIMEKIGMIRDFNGDFSHPKLETNHALSKHVLYRVKK